MRLDLTQPHSFSKAPSSYSTSNVSFTVVMLVCSDIFLLGSSVDIDIITLIDNWLRQNMKTPVLTFLLMAQEYA